MREFEFDFLNKHTIDNKTLSNDLQQKLELSILKYVYSQSMAALLASLFCGMIIFIGLNDTSISQSLFIWSIFFLSVTIVRLYIFVSSQTDSSFRKKTKYWRNMYIIGSLLGGTSWGLAGVILMPHVNSSQQMLLILMLAGVTAGAVQLSAAVPLAAISFLICSVLPFILMILTLQVKVLYVFDIALALYLVYSIFLISVAYRWIKYSIVLTFENDVLVDNLENLNLMLEHAATHDPLTKITNRRWFTYTISNLILDYRGRNKKFALLYLDLDKFKICNDNYGHEAGDQVLLTIVERLKNYFRKEDIFSRLGGDEFAILIENVMNKADLAIIASKICQLIASPIKWHEIELEVSVSIGIAIYPDDGNNMEDLLRCADKGMYAVKLKSGNNFSFSDEIKTDLQTF